MTDFKIDPAAMEAPAGSAITFTISNQGQAPHTFAVTVGDQAYETAEIQAGASDTLEVPALEAGTYETVCTVPGRADLGMTGTLTIAAGAAGGGETTDTSTDGANGGAGTSSHGDMSAEEMAAGNEQA